MLFDTLALIFLIINITLIGRLVNIFPSLLACFIRGKENINLALSAKLSRDRNVLATAMILPFCLTVCRFGLYSPDFMTEMSEAACIGVTLGIFVIYSMLRALLRYAVRPRNMTAAAYNAGAVTSHTFFIILTLLLVTLGGIMTFLDVNDGIIKSTMIWLSGIIYITLLLRKIQIFASSYDYITVFLYLCALEIIPTGVLIASDLIF